MSTNESSYLFQPATTSSYNPGPASMSGSSTIEVTIDLPFYMRLEEPITIRYEEACTESQVQELLGQDIKITFSRRPAGAIDKSGWPKVRSTVAIRAEIPTQLSEDSTSLFAIQNCLEILNRVITSYQAATEDVSNSGFVVPLGTSDMQLFAEIRVDGRDVRDRWPTHSTNTIALARDQADEFKRYVAGKGNLPLSRLFLTNAILSLERGEYPLAILQVATSIELRVTQVVSQNLKAAGWSDQAVEPYERLTLGQKLQIPRTDPRSLETYFSGFDGFANIYKQVRDDLTPLRNRVAHRGYLASHEDAKCAVGMAREFLKIVS